MGSLRLLLAISVIILHAGPFLGAYLVAEPQLIIQMFYILSGFTIAFVWYGKYAGSETPTRTFWINRARRIYPQYYLVLIGAILVSLYAWKTENRHPIATAVLFPVHGLGALWLYLQQLLLAGMETHLFMQRAADGTLEFCANFHQGAHPPLHYYMFVSPAWMLGLQIVFYLLVPWLLPRPKLIAGVLVLSFTARIVAWQCGLNQDPWTHRFFPFELGVLLLGVLSYGLYARIQEHRPRWLARPRIGWAALGGLTGMLLGFPLFRGIGQSAFWMCNLVAVIAFPFAFHATKRFKWDRWLGELSYPVYIVHLLVMSAGEFFLGIPLNRLVYFAIPVSLAAALALDKAQTRIFAPRRHSSS
jgi:peptidoglycan/LPS O-acetylase OafA/YrhL